MKAHQKRDAELRDTATDLGVKDRYGGRFLQSAGLDPDPHETEEAARRIQAIHRGNASRRQLQNGSSSREVPRLRNASPGELVGVRTTGVLRLQARIERDAAVLLQARFRGFQTRGHLRAVRAASPAISTDSLFDNEEVTEEDDEERQQMIAAARIQTIHKGNKVRQELHADKPGNGPAKSQKGVLEPRPPAKPRSGAEGPKSRALKSRAPKDDFDLDVEEMMAVADRLTQNGTLSRIELMTYLGTDTKYQRFCDWLLDDEFKKVDANGDGELSVLELKRAVDAFKAEARSQDQKAQERKASAAAEQEKEPPVGSQADATHKKAATIVPEPPTSLPPPKRRRPRPPPGWKGPPIPVDSAEFLKSKEHSTAWAQDRMERAVERIAGNVPGILPKLQRHTRAAVKLSNLPADSQERLIEQAGKDAAEWYRKEDAQIDAEYARNCKVASMRTKIADWAEQKEKARQAEIERQDAKAKEEEDSKKTEEQKWKKRQEKLRDKVSTYYYKKSGKDEEEARAKDETQREAQKRESQRQKRHNRALKNKLRQWYTENELTGGDRSAATTASPGLQDTVAVEV